MIYISIVIYLLPALIAFLMIHFRGGFGTDRFYHRLVVDLIIKNKHNLIRKHDNVINQNIMSYPQLLHWIMSFLSEKGYQFWSKYLNVLITALLSSLNFLFISLLYPIVASQITLNYGEVMLWCSAIFALIPYSYFGNNAKNVGISSRGVGLLFTQAFVYACILLSLEFNWMYYGAVILLASFILMSSQFATQYLLLAFIPLAVIFQRWELLAIPFAAWALLLIVSRQVAVDMVLGQSRHKVLYATRLAKVSILQHRESIWLDVFNLMPRKIYRVLFGRTKLKDVYPYFQGNALVILVLQMPFIVLIMIKVTEWTDAAFPLNTLFSLLVITTFIFFLTTFRITRFLGEPERYMEFVFGLFGITVLLLYQDQLWIGGSVLAYSVVMIIAQLIQAYQRRFIDSRFFTEAIEYRKMLEDMMDSGTAIRVLANSTEVVKILLSPKIPQYWFIVNGLESDGIRFQEVYPERYETIEPAMFARLIKQYDITHLIVEKRHLKDYDKRLDEMGIARKTVKDSDSIVLFEIESLQ